MVKDSINERVYIWRRRRGLTQGALAAAAGMHPGQISKIERGRSTNLEAETLKSLAVALGVKTDYLLGLIGDDQAEVDYPDPGAVRKKRETAAPERLLTGRKPSRRMKAQRVSA